MTAARFEDFEIGQEIPALSKGPLTPAHIMRWSSSMENWHRIHYDREFAAEHDNLPNVVVNGSWKQHVLIQLVTDWVGDEGWVWKVSFQFRGMNFPGETLTAWGRVGVKQDLGTYGVVIVDIGLKNENGEESTPGTAVTVWPKAAGPPVPYPFDPRVLA